MLKYICDICRKELDENDLVYDLNIEVKAKYNKLEISLKDLLVDHMDEIQELIEKTAGLTAEKLQDDIYKLLSFHLCPACKQRYMNDPLGLKSGSSIRDKRQFGDN